jgi:hypothetical protein
LLLHLFALDCFVESVNISLPWSAASFQIATVVLVTPNCDDSLRRWNFYTQVGLMNDGFKLVEESSAQDAVVRLVHLHHVER